MQPKHMTLTVFGIAALSAIACMEWSREQGLVIHEWGTFTSLQDEAGRNRIDCKASERGKVLGYASP